MAGKGIGALLFVFFVYGVFFLSRPPGPSSLVLGGGWAAGQSCAELLSSAARVGWCVSPEPAVPAGLKVGGRRACPWLLLLLCLPGDFNRPAEFLCLCCSARFSYRCFTCLRFPDALCLRLALLLRPLVGCKKSEAVCERYCVVTTSVPLCPRGRWARSLGVRTAAALPPPWPSVSCETSEEGVPCVARSLLLQCLQPPCVGSKHVSGKAP